MIYENLFCILPSDTYENTEVAQKYLVSSNPQSITGTVETYYSIKDVISQTEESVKKGKYTT